MVASSILPVAIHKGKLYFLFGKENEMEDSAKGFSDFGGRVENNESILDTAYREGSEEFCGFLGDEKSVKQFIQENGGYMTHSHNEYHIHLFSMKYDENLPFYFTNHHRFMWNKMDKDMLNKSKLYEKQEIRWFSADDLKKRRDEFRPFYREIVDELRNRLPEIRKFIVGKTAHYSSKTRRRRSSSKIRGG